MAVRSTGRGDETGGGFVVVPDTGDDPWVGVGINPRRRSKDAMGVEATPSASAATPVAQPAEVLEAAPASGSETASLTDGRPPSDATESLSGLGSAASTPALPSTPSSVASAVSQPTSRTPGLCEMFCTAVFPCCFSGSGPTQKVKV